MAWKGFIKCRWCNFIEERKVKYVWHHKRRKKVSHGHIISYAIASKDRILSWNIVWYISYVFQTTFLNCIFQNRFTSYNQYYLMNIEIRLVKSCLVLSIFTSVICIYHLCILLLAVIFICILPTPYYHLLIRAKACILSTHS